MYKEIFAQRIKKARIDAGYTQPQVAIETKIQKSTISKYETGNLEPDLEKLAKLAEFYAVSTDWLLGIGQKEPAPLSDEQRNRREKALASELMKSEPFLIAVASAVQDTLIAKNKIVDNRSTETIKKYTDSKRALRMKQRNANLGEKA